MRLIYVAWILAATATPAYCNWEYTRWGMSPREVVEASGGKAVPVSEELVRKADSRDGKVKLVQSQTTINGLKLNVAFIFDIKAVPKLRSVGFYKDDCSVKQFNSFEEYLTKLFGDPLSGNAAYPSVMRSLLWFDDAKENWVQSSILFPSGASCQITFTDRMDKPK